MSSPDPIPLPTTRCPLCGGSNQCTPATTGSFDTPCWCVSIPVSPDPPEQRNRACLCPRCATLAGV